MGFSTTNKRWRLTTTVERRGALALLGLMILGMIFETLGVGLVVPALGLMSIDPVDIQTNIGGQCDRLLRLEAGRLIDEATTARLLQALNV